MPEIAVIGVTLSGNKGAASMLLSGVENIARLAPNARFAVLSIYPDEDQAANHDPRVEIVSARPLALLAAVPLALLWWALARLGLSPGLLRRNRILAALDRCQLLVDMSGISFSDGRGAVLAYNVACVLPALLLGRPVMKYSQALGPFETVLNRTLARILLPRLALIAARGEITRGYLRELDLENVTLCADAAFALDETDEPDGPEGFAGRRLVGIAASSVVRAYCRQRGLDYCRILADFVDGLVAAGEYGVWLIAHAVRRSEKGGRTSDVEACQAIYALVQHKQHCRLVVEDHPPAALRAFIGRCDFFVASRFHAMVSALSTGVPVLVTSWSHKYREVLAAFGLEAWTVDYRSLSAAALGERFGALVAQEREVRDRIACHLPGAIESAQQNARLAASLLERGD
ncbi:MAG: polysaccharide pyruvyl transferase family protein [Chloroflexota bacterium]